MPGSPQLVLTVDRSGRGDHRTIQDAIDAAPADTAGGSVVVIRIKPGEEKVVVGKPRISLVGTNAGSTVVTWNESSSVVAASAASPSSTVSVLASDFIAKRLTFQVRVHE
ncbi:hypothetical protein U9M48_018321 [Paspalum notatum var. saurae]|uniref:pectinesterase n=1 Tax=Paspalum notatum var. saurae TaxID=547442 RepID=A0AAQ3WQ74_PASNO